MSKFTSAIAVAAFTLGAAFASPAFAATGTGQITDTEAAAPAGDIIELAYGCDYVIVWDAYGNYYYEYVCY